MEKIRETEERIKALEGMRDIVSKLIKKGKDIYFDPSQIDQTISSFHNRLVDLRYRLDILRGFEISVEPKIPEKPSKPKPALIVAVSLISGLFLGIFIALFTEWLQTARSHHTQI
jgi:LPS O-antigen subunit length determinant protein (WzzB/FepE family)